MCIVYIRNELPTGLPAHFNAIQHRGDILPIRTCGDFYVSFVYRYCHEQSTFSIVWWIFRQSIISTIDNSTTNETFKFLLKLHNFGGPPQTLFGARNAKPLISIWIQYNQAWEFPSNFWRERSWGGHSPIWGIPVCAAWWSSFSTGGGGALKCQGGYQVRPKIHVKRVFFHSLALYVRNVNRVSNLCKIGLKEYDF